MSNDHLSSEEHRLLVDALYYAWLQADAAGIPDRAKQFRSLYEKARLGKIADVESLQRTNAELWNVIHQTRADRDHNEQVIKRLREENARLKNGGPVVTG